MHFKKQPKVGLFGREMKMRHVWSTSPKNETRIWMTLGPFTKRERGLGHAPWSLKWPLGLLQRGAMREDRKCMSNTDSEAHAQLRGCIQA